MIIERIEVKQFQRHLMPATLTFADRGVTLVEGPNESGKSTMFRALREAFLRNAGSAASVVKKFQPWAGDGNLAPAVTVDFIYGGKYYRLLKSWGARKEAALYVYPNAERRDGDAGMIGEPDEFLAGIFAAKVGATTELTAPQLGLMHLLFAPQGRVRLDDEQGLSDEARQRLGAIIGVAAETGAETNAVRKVKKIYDEYYTKGHKLKANAPSKGLEERLKTIQGALGDARREAADIERLRGELESAMKRVSAADARLDQAKTRKAEELPKVIEAQRLKANLDRAGQTLESRKREYDTLVAEAEQIDGLRKRAAELLAEIEPAQERYENALSAFEQAEAERAAAVAAMNQAAGEDAETVRLQAEHDALAQMLRQQTDYQRLSADLKRLGDLDRDIAALAGELAQTHAVPPEVLENAARVLAELTSLTARIEASQLVLTVAATGRFDAAVTTSEGVSDVSLASAESATRRSDGTIEIALPNARLIVRGPVADLSADKLRLAQLSQELGGIEAAFGTSDAVALQRMADRHAAAEHKAKALKGQREDLLGDATSEEMRVRLEMLKAAAESAPADETQIGEIKAQIDARRSEVEELRRQTKRAAEVTGASCEASKNQCETARKQLADALGELRSTESKLEMLPGASKSDDERQRARSEAYAQHQQAVDGLAALEKAYEPYAGLGDPHARVNVLENAVAEAHKLLEQDQQKFVQVQTALEMKREQGIAAKVPEFEANEVELAHQLHAAQSREQAAKLLHDTIDEHLSARNTLLAGPIIPIVCEWYRLVTGKQLAQLDIDTKASVSGLRYVDYATDVELGDLSEGAADQLCLLIRLAYAKVLADRNPEEPMPVVLDDVLVNCDESRGRRLIDIINRVAEQTQIILLTCDPSPYLGQGWAIGTVTPEHAAA